MPGTQLGTPGYMAPEQLRGQPIDARADVFAFGVMAYELATGTHPLGGSDAAAIVERLVAEDHPLSRPLESAGTRSRHPQLHRGDPSAGSLRAGTAARCARSDRNRRRHRLPRR